jgi:hypothetical protein
MIHWMAHPGYLVILFLFLFLVLFFLPGFESKRSMQIKKMMLAGTVLYLLLTAVVMIFRGENWEWTGPTGFHSGSERNLVFDPVDFWPDKIENSQAENQKIEGCLLCHGAMKGLSDSHNPASTGCFACHKGDPFTSDKSKAHKGMILIAGNFTNVDQTCGTQNCHPEIAGRMTSSLMTTQSGIIGVDKYVFGETASLNDSFNVKNLNHSAADTHLRNLCANCHLGNEKTKIGDAFWLERGGGCNACHLRYSTQATETAERIKQKLSPSKDEVHPAIDIQVSNDHCTSCHSRSGRISLSYEGWSETALQKSEVTDSLRFKILPDDRVLEFIKADIHHQKGMACIDCHGSYEIMGDGKHHAHKEDAVSVQCVDCHVVGRPNIQNIRMLPDRESQMIAGLRKVDARNNILVTARGNYPILNTKVDSLGRILLTDKLDGKDHLSRPVSPVCRKGKGHERLSCEACHTAWIPQCLGCHNAYEKETNGLDLLAGKPVVGSWVEFAGKSYAEPPVLGIREKGKGLVVTAMPGMIMTIDQEAFDKSKGKSFHRLFAPASGHTTRREGRGCKSCHNNPLALGFGRGELHFVVSGKAGQWKFEPRFAANKFDGLPEDAWTGFLRDATKPYATRSDLRPFSVAEQKRILQVGSCLTCHDEESKVMAWTLEDFDKTVAKCKGQCVRIAFDPIKS